MIFLFMIIFIYAAPIYSMHQNVIDQDYEALVPYVVRMLQVTKDDYSPFQLLEFLARPDALINSTVRCNHLSPSGHLQYLLRKQRIRMGRDYEKQKSVLNSLTDIEQKDQLFAWFIAYFQTYVVDRIKKELNQELDQKAGYETNSRNGFLLKPFGSMEPFDRLRINSANGLSAVLRDASNDAPQDERKDAFTLEQSREI